ncbi:MAG: flippase [Desulfuromonadia bacterium]
MGTGLIVGVWVARYLGPHLFGQLNFALAFVSIFSAVASLGLDSIVVRELVRDPENEKVILASAWTLRLLGGTVATVLAVVAIVISDPSDHVEIILVVITAIGMIFQSFDTLEQWFQARLQSRYAVYVRNFVFFACAFGKIILIRLSAPLVAFAAMGLLEIILGAFALAIAYLILAKSAICFSLQRAKELLRDSWPLIFSSLVTMVYLRIDQIMLKEIVGDRELGVYSAAVKIAEVWYFIPMAIHASVTPHVVEEKKHGEDRFLSCLQKIYNLMAFIGYAVAVPLSLAGPFIVSILYGVEYARGGIMLSLLAWSILFVNMGVARSLYLTTMNWNKVHFVTVLIGAIVNVTLNVWLIPRFGGFGAAIATLVSYWVAAHLSCYLYRPLRTTGEMLTSALMNPRFW